MAVRYAELRGASGREARAAFLAEIGQLREALGLGRGAADRALLRRLGARACPPDQVGAPLCIELQNPDLRCQFEEALALLSDSVREAEPLELGFALEQVKLLYGIDLSTARVRVGITRGHLLEVVLEVSGAQSLDEELSLSAAEALISRLCGARVFSTWILSVKVTCGPRHGSLRVIDPGRAALMYPVLELPDLLFRGIEGLRGSRYTFGQELGQEWTMLELGEGGQALQADRRFATTLLPEAMKCALEGLPFQSERFFAGDQMLVWLELPRTSSGAEARLGRLESLENGLGANAQVIGRGFGSQYDYLDLLVSREPEAIGRVRGISSAQSSGSLGFYDEHLRAEELSFDVSFKS